MDSRFNERGDKSSMKREELTLAFGFPTYDVYNPLTYRSLGDLWVMGCVYQGVASLDRNLRLVGRLGEISSVNEKSYRIRLRPDIYWHDGKPVTAEDVSFTYHCSLAPSYQGNRGFGFLNLVGGMEYRKGTIDSIPGIEILNTKELILHTTHLSDSFLHQLLLPIVPRHLFKDCQEMITDPVTRPVGCGPYRYIESNGSSVTVERHDRFHLGRPPIERMTMRFTSQGEAIEMVLSGNADFAVAFPDDALRITEVPGMRLFHWPQPYYEFVALNHQHPLLGRTAFRQGIMHSIDREAVTLKVLHGYGEVLNHPIPPLVMDTSRIGVNAYRYDPAVGAQLLEEAGCVRGEDGSWLADGSEVHLSFGVDQGQPLQLKAARIIQQHLEAFGLRVDLHTLEPYAFHKRAWEEREFDLWMGGWNYPLDGDPSPYFGRTSRWVACLGWQDEECFHMLDSARQSVSGNMPESIYREWCSLVNRELPILFMYTPEHLEVAGRRLTGLKPDPRGALWNIHEIGLSPEGAS